MSSQQERGFGGIRFGVPRRVVALAAAVATAFGVWAAGFAQPAAAQPLIIYGQLVGLAGFVYQDHIGPGTSLGDQLVTAANDVAADNTAQACVDLQSFISHVNAQSGKMVSAADASLLVAEATSIRSELSC